MPNIEASVSLDTLVLLKESKVEQNLFALRIQGCKQYLGNFEILSGGFASEAPERNEPATFGTENAAEIALDSYEYRCILNGNEPLPVEVEAI